MLIGYYGDLDKTKQAEMTWMDMDYEENEQQTITYLTSSLSLSLGVPGLLLSLN
jgi:hypothetical protein